MKRLNYGLVRRFVRMWARPTLIGREQPPDEEVVYALSSRSLTDVVLLDIVAAQRGWRSPMSALEDLDEAQRFFFLNRPAGFWRRNTMRTLPPRLLRLETKLADADTDLALVPVSMFWGRAANKERSLIRSLFSEGWAVSSRFRRFIVLLLNRGDIIVHFGEPLPWPGGASARRDLRRESLQRGSARGNPSQEESLQPGSGRGNPSQEESPQPGSARGNPSQEE
ncbi:MAG: hypothetical protein OXG82_19970, partial [Gammaproteobacteria bacterium]|nr:hypothetical protein [Gammaproteobacteria bacterium]